jgi:hypothetical protein
MEICSGDGRRARYVDPWSCYPLTLSSRNTLPFFPAPPAFLRDGPPVCWDDMMLIVQHRGRLENETDLNRHGLVEMLRFVVLIRGGRGSPPGPGTSGGRRFSVSASNDRSRLLISPRTNHHPFFCRLNHFHHVTNTQFRRRPRFRSRHQTHQPRRARWLTCPLHPVSVLVRTRPPGAHWRAEHLGSGVLGVRRGAPGLACCRCYRRCFSGG